ncbi:polysaccharide deacetylase family protein [Bacillus salacetis]|uniref:Polysaccharide deacetylase family protein n=1 Tax=Bacillus salacetis TaxID=2315464 RepID=A0A3A1QRF6_9BACI|nr:polysaccharide deacetylase family protein [Bacillus salacetis]RIW29483.1 polysaccharide deacetylase family protein [Bacillus salacetis]
MKKLIFCSCLFLLAAGCSDNQSSEPVGNTADQEEEAVNEVSAAEKENKEKESVSDEEATDDNEKEDEEAIQEEEIKEPLYTINEENWSVQPISDANEKVVLLTIDDAPDKHAVDMAKTLKSHDADAIFFVNGHFLDTEEERQKLKEIHDMGFAIGNHTYNHQKLDDVSEEKQREEILKLNDLITDIIGEKPKFFRAPHGANTDFVKNLVKEEGMTLMNWTYGYDYFKPYMDAEKLKTAMITGEGPEVDVPYSLLKSGANLLMHDREWTNEALGDIVKGLREKGYEILDPGLIKTP